MTIISVVLKACLRILNLKVFIIPIIFHTDTLAYVLYYIKRSNKYCLTPILNITQFSLDHLVLDDVLVPSSGYFKLLCVDVTYNNKTVANQSIIMCFL